MKVAVCDKCVRLATKKKSGELTTPSFSLDGATAKLTFNAAAQLGDKSTIIVEIVGGGYLTYDGTTDYRIGIALPETEAGVTTLSSQTYTLEISGASSCQIKFTAVSSQDD